MDIPTTTHYIKQGTGAPVILIHGMSASLHDWDALIPQLTKHGYASYALDLLGHGESPKPKSRAYQMEWIFEHFANWMTSLQLTEPAVLIGHSLGGYIALEYARRFSAGTRGLVLVDPFYSRSQLPALMRAVYSRSDLASWIVERTPRWIFRIIADISSVSMGYSIGALHSLPKHIRVQTALDYIHTAPGIYNVLNKVEDLTPYLSAIDCPTMVVWGDHDSTLAPVSFETMVKAMPHATSKIFPAGHVPHQSKAEGFNRLVLEFLKSLS